MNCNSPFTFEKSKSFRSFDGDGSNLSGPFIDATGCRWLLFILRPLFMFSLLLLVDIFSLNDNWDVVILEIEFKFDEFRLLDDVSLSGVCVFTATGVFGLDNCWWRSFIGLRKLSHCLNNDGGDRDLSSFGDFGRVNANACVCKITRKKNKLSIIISWILSTPTKQIIELHLTVHKSHARDFILFTLLSSIED